MSKVVSLIGFGLIVYYWSLTQKLKQLAYTAAHSRCKEAGIQLLDQTVVMSKIRLKNVVGRGIRFQRVYLFEFTSTGEQRYQGRVVIHGKHILEIKLEAYLIN